MLSQTSAVLGNPIWAVCYCFIKWICCVSICRPAGGQVWVGGVMRAASGCSWELCCTETCLKGA